MPTVIPSTPQQQQASQYFTPLPTSVLNGMLRLFAHLQRAGGPSHSTVNADITDALSSPEYQPLVTQPLYESYLGDDVDRKIGSLFGFRGQ